MENGVDDLLAEFVSLRKPGPHAYEWSSTHGEGRHETHLVIGSVVHGDETGSLPAVVRVMRELRQGSLRFGGKLTLFLGNPEAARAGVRFLQTDLNRMFGPELSDSHEGQRATQIKPILDEATVFIDLHQTILRTEQPFWIFPFQVPGWLWARAIGTAQVWVTRHPQQQFSLEGCCADEYVRNAGRPGITIELSQRGFGNGAEERAWETITRAMAVADAVAAGAPLRHLAEARPEITFYETAHREPFATDEHALRDGLTNFAPVQAGELLSAPSSPPMVAPLAGCVLFPKYPPRDGDSYKRPLPAEIYRVIRALDDHPLDRYGMRAAFDRDTEGR